MAQVLSLVIVCGADGNPTILINALEFKGKIQIQSLREKNCQDTALIMLRTDKGKYLSVSLYIDVP